MSKLIDTVSKLNSLSDVTKLINHKWPEALIDHQAAASLFSTGLKAFDGLFPSGGIPYGQLIELTGDAGSGKTSLLWRLVAALTKQRQVAYVDLSGSFFAASALTAGVNLKRLVVARPDSLAAAARATELIIQHKLCAVVVCDLVRINRVKTAKEIFNIPWCHRLRSRTMRAKGLVIFVTENNSEVIPPSMVALRLEVSRVDAERVIVRVGRSRICAEGSSAEVKLYED